MIEDGSVVWERGSTLYGRVGYRFRNGLEPALEGFNLLDTDDSDIEYCYPSRLPGEPFRGVEEVQFHPLESRTIRLVAAWRR